MSTVAVIGATGRQGLSQVSALLKAGYEVRALSRKPNPSTLEVFADRVDFRHLDIEDEKTLIPALDGSDFVFYNHPLHLNEQKVELTERVGKACKAVNVSRLIWNTSSWIPDRPGDPYTYSRNTLAINRLWATGVPATVFGAVLFMDNLLTDWARPSLMNDRRYIYPHAPDIGANWISLDDVAKIMVTSLERPDLAGSWMNIGGPEKLNGPAVAKILSGALGFELDYAPYTPEEFANALVLALGDSLSPAQRQQFAIYISEFYHFNNTSPTQPFSVDTNYMYSRLPEVELETMSEWARRQNWSHTADRPSGG